VKARLHDDLAAIDVVLALVRHCAQDMQIPAFDTHLAMAGDQLVKAGRRVSGSRRRPDGMLRSRWVAVEVAGMGVVAFGCAYASAVLLDLPRWLSVLAVIAGQFVLSCAVLPLSRRFDARLLSSTPPGWLAEQIVPHDMVGEDVDVLLARARTMVGQLAVRRLHRVAIPVTSGRAAQSVGAHDALLMPWTDSVTSRAAIVDSWVRHQGKGSLGALWEMADFAASWGMRDQARVLLRYGHRDLPRHRHRFVAVAAKHQL
jgi:hypothetical protein